jgi:hypothetical protein
MYNDDVTRVPGDWDEFWEVMRGQFEFVRHVLYELEVETREEALENSFHHVSDDGAVRRDGMLAIRYRSIGEDLDQLDHFLAMGRDLLPYINQAIDERTYTPEFVQQWGKIMFCHGYVAAFVFDDTDGLAHHRAGRITGQKRSKDAQRKWIANIMLPLIDGRLTRAQAEEAVLARVAEALKNPALRGQFPESWFQSIVTRGGLAATYDEKHFSKKLMRELVEEPTDDIPPLP